ncbi:MAG: zf-HC2 domain-containing protein, partial [Candidatus Nanoarchaeia archaeon]
MKDDAKIQNDSCRKYSQMMTDLLAGEIRNEDKAELEKHIEKCADCSKEFREIRKTWELVQNAIKDEKLPETTTFTEEEVRKIAVEAEKKQASVKRLPLLSIIVRIAALFTIGLILAGLFLPALSSARYKAKAITTRQRLIEMGKTLNNRVDESSPQPACSPERSFSDLSDAISEKKDWAGDKSAPSKGIAEKKSFLGNMFPPETPPAYSPLPASANYKSKPKPAEFDFDFDGETPERNEASALDNIETVESIENVEGGKRYGGGAKKTIELSKREPPVVASARKSEEPSEKYRRLERDKITEELKEEEQSEKKVQEKQIQAKPKLLSRTYQLDLKLWDITDEQTAREFLKRKNAKFADSVKITVDKDSNQITVS